MADLFGEFMNLVQPWQPPPDAAGKKGDKQPPATTPDQLTQPSGAPFDQFMKLVTPGAPQAAQTTSTDKLMQPSPEMAKVAPTLEVIGKVGKGLLKEFTDIVAAPGRTLADKPQTPGMLSDVDVARQQMQQEGAPAWGFNTAGLIAGGRSPFIKPSTTELGALGGGAPKGLGWLENIVSPATRISKDIISPATRTASGQSAAAAIREASGKAARDIAIIQDKMEAYHKTVNAMSGPERWAFTNYFEGGPGEHYDASTGRTTRVATSLPPELRGMAKVLRDGYKQRENKLRALPETAQMDFIKNYAAHFFENPKAATSVMQQGVGGGGKLGSSASTHKRIIPMYEDAMAMGIKPRTDNPLQMAVWYFTSMDHFIARTEVTGAAIRNKTITFPKRQQFGASGHPESMPRTDLVPVQGVFDKNGVQGMAPEDWARVYNNYVGQKWAGNADFQNVANAVQKSTNAITSMELGLSAFHFTTMANEAITSEVARGIANLAELSIPGLTRGLGAIAKAPLAPVRLYRLGKKGADVYLDRSPGSKDTRDLIDLITRAGGRMVGKEHAADYQYSAMGDFWTAFQRGATKQNLRNSLERAQGGPVSATKEAFSLLGKTMETIAYPLFVKYIPALKNGAAMELLSDWLKANPTATGELKLAMARKIWDSIDNRFGEMVQDNLFWDATLKQIAQTGMRSFSWNMGTIREIGGGVAGLRNPSRFSISSPDFNPKMSYTLALPAVAVALASVYAFLKSGGDFSKIEATAYPQTGGTAPGFGGRGEVPERAVLPGYWTKDVHGWWSDPVREAGNKVGTLPKMAWQTLQNEDYQGHLIRNPDDPVLKQISEYFQWVGRSMGGPISVRNLAKGQKTGSNISTLETIMGITAAPSNVQDPEGYERGLSKIYRERWKREERSRQRQDRQYEQSDVTRPDVPVTRRPTVTVTRRPQ
jgi:hypothetical protein